GGHLDGPGGRPHDLLRAQARRDHRLRGDGAGAARAAERALRRGGTARMRGRPAVRALTGWVAAHPVLSFFVFFAIFPFLLPYKALATQVLIFGLFALGFNLLYGYTGLLSFGHAAYYGLGAYGTGIALAKLQVGSLWAGLGAGLLLAAAGGAVIGYFCLQRRGIYFAMLTLAFAQLLYFIAFHLPDWTGAGTFFGPFVGAATFLVLEDRLSVFTESWPLVIGAIFSVFVLFLPSGIWGTLTGGLLHGHQGR